VTRLFLLAATANAWVLLAVLTGAMADQFLTGEPPCPLCVMQRIAMMLAAMGPVHILLAARRDGLTARDIGLGSGLLILGSLLGAAISIRQILLHILPGDPGFGAPVLGYHLYTWALIVFACCIAAAGAQLAGLAWFQPGPAIPVPLTRLTAAALAVTLIANIASVIAEAGLAWHLPDNPVTYLLFRGG